LTRRFTEGSDKILEMKKWPRTQFSRDQNPFPRAASIGLEERTFTVGILISHGVAILEKLILGLACFIKTIGFRERI
jgi:hypothetical protein